MFKRHSKSFTLIELMVVVLIIGLLAAMVIINVDHARKKGRDAKRIADLTSVASALQLYYADRHTYPPAPAGGIATSKQRYVTMVESLIAEQYLNYCPQEPTVKGTPDPCIDPPYNPTRYGYRYYSDGATYILKSFVEIEENGTSQSPSFSWKDYAIKDGEPYYGS